MKYICISKMTKKNGSTNTFCTRQQVIFYYMLAKPDGVKSSFQAYYLHSQQV